MCTLFGYFSSTHFPPARTQPLLAQAQAQRESRQPLAGGSRSHSDALAAASWRASQYAAQTGAGVSEIRELKQMLS